MKSNNLITKKQFGFLKGRSTTLQMINVLDDWTKILDGGGNIDVIYTDFQKAFDTVPHDRLLKKLEAYGIGENILDWISSFLKGRKQRVVIKGTASSWVDVLSGVPQGNVLGSILFLIYINNIIDNLKCNAYLFADDMKLFTDVKNNSDALKLQNDFNLVVKWTDRWLLKLNISKCKVLNIRTHPNNIIHNHYISLGDKDQYLLNSNCEKDLGISVDSELKFENHIMDKVKKANRILGLIKRSFSYLNFESFLLLYKSLIRSQLEYAQFGVHTKKNTLML